MIVEKITITAGRTRPDPNHSFSSLRPEITIEARVEAGEDWRAVAGDLQKQAEQMVEDHTNLLVIQLIRTGKMLKFRDRVLIDLHEVMTRAEQNLRIARAKAPHKTVFSEMDSPTGESENVD